MRPVHKAESNQPHPMHNPIRASSSNTNPRARILVVDDDPVICGIHAMVLEVEGYEVATADDGADALTQIAAGRFDLVLTDRNMPRLDGASMVLALRSAGSQIPVVMVSGSIGHIPLPPVVERELSAAMAKPVRIADMLAVVARTLKRAPRRESLRRFADDLEFTP